MALYNTIGESCILARTGLAATNKTLTQTIETLLEKPHEALGADAAKSSALLALQVHLKQLNRYPHVSVCLFGCLSPPSFYFCGLNGK